MEKLTKKSITYLHILNAIWLAVSYYSRLFGIDAGEEPADTKTFLLEREGVTIIRFKFPFCDALTDKKYSFGEMAEIIQQYLDYCILPSDKILRPYVGGSTIYDIVEPLNIDKVEWTEKAWSIDVAYIDDPVSFQYMQNKKWKGDLLL